MKFLDFSQGEGGAYGGILVEISRVLDDAAVILDSRYIQDRGGGRKRGRRTNQISESIIVHTSSNSNP